MDKSDFYPDTDNDIEPEKARFLYEEHCAIVILEGLPIGSEFGIDLNSFNIGEKFKGAKLIPPGLHFIYVSSVDKSGRQYGPRCGFYHVFKEKELMIKRWSSQEEEFDQLYTPTEEEYNRYRSNLKDLDRYLGAYRFSSFKSYLSLSDRILPEILERVHPDCRLIRAVPYLTEIEDREKGCDSRASNFSRRQPRRTLVKCDNSKLSEESLLPDLKPAKETQIKFTPIPTDHSFCKLQSQSDVTEFYLDTTNKLELTFEGSSGLDCLLGEFQFAFLTLILGHVYDCLEHWRQILVLVCSADKALSRHEQFFIDFTSVLIAQFGHVPEDLFEDIVDQENLIRHYLDIYFQNVIQSQQTSSTNSGLLRIVSKLRQLIEDKFKWQFGLEQDDEQPLVVAL